MAAKPSSSVYSSILSIGSNFISKFRLLHLRLVSRTTAKILSAGIPLCVITWTYFDKRIDLLAPQIHTRLPSLFHEISLEHRNVALGLLVRFSLIMLYVFSTSGLRRTMFSILTAVSVPTSILIQYLLSSIHQQPHMPFPRILNRSLPFDLAFMSSAFFCIQGFRKGAFAIGLVQGILVTRALGEAQNHIASHVCFGVTSGLIYSMAAMGLITQEETEKQREKEQKEKWAKEHAERERRAALPLHENMRLIVQTPTAKLPVAIDFPRLANKMELVDANGTTLISLANNIANSTSPPIEQIMRDVLCGLARCVPNVELAETISRRFEEFLPIAEWGATRAMDQIVAKLLNTLVGDDSTPTVLLRACNQAAISPAVLVLKKAIGMQLPYKDIRGEWWIHIRFTTNDIRITHRKREQSWNTPVGQEFKFTWELQLRFNRQASDLLSSNVHVTDVEFADAAPPEHRTKVMNVMREFYKPHIQQS